MSFPRAVTDSSARSPISTARAVAQPQHGPRAARRAHAPRPRRAPRPAPSASARPPSTRWSAPLTDCTAARLPGGTREEGLPRAPGREAERPAARRRRRRSAAAPRLAAAAAGLAARHGRTASRRPPGSRKAARQAAHSRRWSSTSSARAAFSSPAAMRGQQRPHVGAAVDRLEARRSGACGASRSHTRAAAASATRPRAPRRRARPRPRRPASCPGRFMACLSSWHRNSCWRRWRVRCSVTATRHARHAQQPRDLLVVVALEVAEREHLGGPRRQRREACRSHARSSAASCDLIGPLRGASAEPWASSSATLGRSRRARSRSSAALTAAR